jgi:YD repeat-containing protein
MRPRISGSKATDPPVDYGYDAAGNRTSAGSTTYSYDALNELTGSSAGTTYSYDGAGRLTQAQNGSQTTTYSWDPLDQLTQVDDGTNLVDYTYDALGRRASRVASGSAVATHYGDLTDRAILETDASGILRSFVQGPLGLVEERSGGRRAIRSPMRTAISPPWRTPQAP